MYLAANKKRGLPEGYVRGLEKLWAIILQKVEGLEDTTQRIITGNEDELLRIWNHHRHGEDLHKIWKESSVLSELERLLSRLEEHSASNLKRKRDRDDDEETVSSSLSIPPNLGSGALTPQFWVADLFEGAQNADIQASASDEVFTQSLLDQSLPARSEAELSVLPAATSSLLNHYFTYTHCWFPILDRARTLKVFYEHTRSHNSRTAKTSDLAHLWAICAYCAQQRSPLATEGTDVRMMRTMARRCIPSEDGPFALGHIQALVILVLLDIGMGKWTSAWILIGLAVRALLDILDSGKSIQADRTIRASHEQKWTGTLQACFILDTLISMRLRRSPHLQKEHIEHVHLAEDGLEEWSPWNGESTDMPVDREPAFIRSCFNRLTETFMLANKVATSDKMGRLQRLAGTCPFKVSEIKRRPPHQMILQASYFVVLATNSNPETRANPFKEFLALLGVFHDTWAAAAGIPSIFAALFHTINSPSDAPDGSQPPYFSTQQSQILSRLSKVWPGFKPIEGDVPIDPQLSVPGDGPDLGSPIPVQEQRPQYHMPLPLSSTSGISYYDNMDAPSTTLDIDVPYEAAGHGLSGYPVAMDLSVQTQPVVVGYGVQDNGLPKQPQLLAARGTSLSMQQGSIMGTATSPSFDGDEIDALFDEMAQLDTSEWSSDRMQGLRDFGFTDESTFEAFCNDPGRLMLSNGNMDPTFGFHTDTFALAGQPRGLGNHMPEPGSQTNPFGLPNNTWAPS